VTWHLLRHWHTTVLHDEGVSIKVTQERLGHSRAETTMKHYVHLSQQADAKAANAVSRRLRRGSKTRNSRNFVGRIVSRTRVAGTKQNVSAARNLEARVGFEPTNGGFADLSLGPLGYRAELLSIANWKREAGRWSLEACSRRPAGLFIARRQRGVDFGFA
jgi:hypothetical protein